MHDHISGSGHRTYRAGGQRFGIHAGVGHAVELSDRWNLGQPDLQHIEAFDIVGAGVVMKDARVGDDGVLAHRAVGRRLRLNGISRSREGSRGQQIGHVDDGWFLVLAPRGTELRGLDAGYRRWWRRRLYARRRRGLGWLGPG